jgi:hypothetical protein
MRWNGLRFGLTGNLAWLYFDILPDSLGGQRQNLPVDEVSLE